MFGRTADGSYNTTLALGGPSGDAFANYLQKLGQEKVLDPSIDGDIAKQAFLDGKAPYIVTGPWNTTAFTKAGMDISVLPVPSAGGQTAQPFVGVQGAFISSKTKNAVLANEFVVNFLTTEKVQTELYKAGGRLPALTAVGRQGRRPGAQGLHRGRHDRRPDAVDPRDGLRLGLLGRDRGRRSSTARPPTRRRPGTRWSTNIQGAIDAG